MTSEIVDSLKAGFWTIIILLMAAFILTFLILHKPVNTVPAHKEVLVGDSHCWVTTVCSTDGLKCEDKVDLSHCH